jgi:hypothetical protein
MKETRTRNRRTVEMLEQGVCPQDVARKFRLSPERIRLIEREAATEKSLAQRRGRLQTEIRSADDLDKPWAVVDLIDALWLIVIAQVRLLAYFEEINRTQMSLRELMDLAILETLDGDSERVKTPLLGIRGIGKYGYYSVIAELTEMDLGPHGNEEWRRRLIKLRQHWKIPCWPPNPRRKDEG